MKIAEILKNAKKTHFSFEIVPPLVGHSAKSLYEKIELLTEFNPLNINITYHQDETVYKQIDNNVMSKNSFVNVPEQWLLQPPYATGFKALPQCRTSSAVE